MWLPKDERETLLFYYRQFASGKIPLQTRTPWDEGIHFRLSNRDLINITAVPSALLISLTPEGIDLGQKYNSKAGTIGIWCSEHKAILSIIPILSLIIGATSLLINISSRTTGKNNASQMESKQGAEHQMAQPSIQAKSSLRSSDGQKELNEPNTKRYNY
jgi:hypothetical protein